MGQYSEIIRRAEEVRTRLGLNKTQFSMTFGMKPQTYNNFIGSQGSKPNIALIDGIVRKFNVNPLWLLSGNGEPFQDQVSERFESQVPTSTIPGNGRQSESFSDQTLFRLKHALDLLLAAKDARALHALEQGGYSSAQLDHAVQVVTHCFCVSPVGTASRVVEMLEDFRRIAGEMESVANLKKASSMG